MCQTSPNNAGKPKHAYKDLNGDFCKRDRILGYDSARNPIRADFRGTIAYDKDFPNHFFLDFLKYGNNEGFYAETGRQAILRIQHLTSEARKHSLWNQASRIPRKENSVF